MAPNADGLCQAIVDSIGSRLPLATQFIHDRPWQERERLFDAGEIHVSWICGLPYVHKADQPDPQVELLVAPVMQGDRYHGRPVYFSDVIVRKDSPFNHFSELRGTMWAYNEPRSHSGYYVTCAHLAELGESLDYFGQMIASGAHQTSLRWLLTGKIDATAIDSTVLETELRQNPHLRSELRVITTLGPSPAPPWIISTAVPPTLREQVRSQFLTLSDQPQGQQILAAAAIARFVTVTDQDYDPIRAMARRAETVIHAKR